MTYLVFISGAVAVILFRALFVRLFQAKVRRDVRQLNRGNYRPLLATYSDDATLRFDEGSHRWSGTHRGKAAIERFLKEFVDAGVQGQIHDIWVSGPPWALKLAARFDDNATGPDGSRVYWNRTVLVARCRWAKIVDQEDFYVDTRRLDQFEETLNQIGKHRDDAHSEPG